MRKITVLLFFTISSIVESYSQTYIEPLCGYQIDLKNKSRFSQLNSGIQISFKRSSRYELIIALQKSFALPNKSTDSAFSLNPTVPIYTSAYKTIRPSTTSLAFGQRIVLAESNKLNIFSLLIYTGITSQNFKVQYQYDKNNYIILNPDKTLQIVGIYGSAGFEYMCHLKRGRLFFHAIASTPAASKKATYPYSFRSMAPLSLNAGYSIMLKKRQ